METFSTSSAANDIPVTDPISIEAFNTALGTLLNVSVTLTATTSGEVDVYNNTANTVSFSNASASIPITVTGPGNTSLSVMLSQSGVSDSSLSAYSLYRNYITPVTASDTEVATSNLSMWEGTSGQTLQFSVNFQGNGTYGGTGPFQVYFGGNAAGSATTSVTYTYEVVPEPATTGLMMLALTGLALVGVMRTRRARASGLA